MAQDAGEEEKVNLKFVAKALMSTSKEVGGWSAGDVSLGILYLKKHNTKLHQEALAKKEFHFDPALAVKDKELMSRLQHTWELADGTYQNSDEQLIRATSIKKQNLLTSNWKSQAFTPAYFIALDDVTKSVVFGVRGTASVMDVLTDLAAKPLPFLSGHGHEGIVSGANLVWKAMKPELLKAVNDNKATHPNLMFVGHSLGAGVSALLTMLAIEDLDFKGVNVHCYAFAPPPVASHDLVEKYKGSITSIINEFDAVPRMTLNAVNALREDVAHFDWKNAAMDSAAKSRLGSGAINLKSKIGGSKAYRKSKDVSAKAAASIKNAGRAIAQSSAAKKAGAFASSLFKKKDKVEEPKVEPEAVDVKIDNPAPDPTIAENAEAKAELQKIGLFPPGTIYHICIDGDERCYLVPRDNDYFCTLAVQAGMFKHHGLGEYAVGLRSHLKHMN